MAPNELCINTHLPLDILSLCRKFEDTKVITADTYHASYMQP